MYEPVKFKNLRDLGKELNEKLETLLDGNLSVDQLEQMTTNSRELYERLLVLRHKAYDTVTKDGVTVENGFIKEEKEIKEFIPFKIEPVKPEILANQVSLIDAIEEVTNQESSLEVNPKSNLESSPEPIPQMDLSSYTTPVEKENILNYSEKGKESVYERLTKDYMVRETLAERLEHNPIPDLKKAISLNQRFQFSKELFKGNNQEYEMALEKLNSLSKEEAMKHMNSLKSKYSWNSESSVVNDFVELVERRHQH